MRKSEANRNKVAATLVGRYPGGLEARCWRDRKYELVLSSVDNQVYVRFEKAYLSKVYLACDMLSICGNELKVL